jgi:flagellar biosynthesis protein FlhF
MQVKKFEAATMQEALENVKRELGPEAVILQTRNQKKGLGLLSKGAFVEVTAAVSERSMTKKTRVESRLPASSREALNQLPAEKQAGVYDKYTSRHLQRAESTQERVQIGSKREKAVGAKADPAEASKKITATRYIDIEDDKSKLDRFSRTNSPLGADSRTQEPPSRQASSSDLEREVKELKQMLEDLRKSQAEPRERNFLDRGAENEQRNAMIQISLDIPALHDAFEQLVVNGVDRRYALALVKKAGFALGEQESKKLDLVLDAVASELMDTIRVMSPLNQIEAERRAGGFKGPAVVSFIGPTGVGKTTTLAKIASEAQAKRRLKVGLINLDYFKVTAFDQLATYGKILHVPFRSVASVDDLRVALHDFKNLDLVLVDTTGRSHRDPQSLNEVQELLAAVPELITFLTLSATTRDSELFDAASKFSNFKPRGLVLSKLDEVIVYGGIYNISQKVDLPLLYFTTGQKVPDDIEEATRERLVSLLLGF